MSTVSFLHAAKLKAHPTFRVGTVGYLAVFGWALATILLAPPALTPWCAGICLFVAGLVYPLSIRRLLRPRLLLMLVLLTLPPVFWGEPDYHLGVIPISAAGLLLGVQMALRAIVIFVFANGLTAAVDISALAGLFERLGLHGLGFSMGVALNLLPALQQSATNAWHSLKMRGGLKRQRRRGVQLLAMTVITNALRRAEEIALAAEARAFSPENCRALPLKSGNLDWAIGVTGILSLFLLLIL